MAGAAGIGDPYFPQDGNGGYDVAHYDVHDTYRLRERRAARAHDGLGRRDRARSRRSTST